MKRAVISAYVRSPFTPAFSGGLSDLRPDDMAAQIVRGLIDRVKLDDNKIEDLILGCAFPEGEQGLNVARLVGFLAKLPVSVGAMTVNRFCGSSMQAIHIASANIMANHGDCFIAGGLESMTKVPMTGFNPLPNPKLFEEYPESYENMGITAENLAKKYHISRKLQEEFALSSQEKAANASKNGNFAEEIIKIKHNNSIISEDECIRGNSTIEDLSNLKPAFDAYGTVTAGTSSPLTDGASACLVVSEEFADKNNLPKLAYVKSFAVSGCKPDIMGIGPVEASKKALKRASLNLSDIDIIELNEAFSAQALSVIKESGFNKGIMNIDGGALALGHPLGASGARITGKAASLLKRENKKYALATMCIGGGQGISTILEAV